MIRLELPWPPSVNKARGERRYGQTPHTYTAKAVKIYRKTVAAICMMQRVKPLKGELICGLQLHPSKGSRMDVDNALKVVLDALVKAGCMADDRQIKTLLVDHQGERIEEASITCALYPRAGVKRLEVIIDKGCLIHKT